MKSIGVRAAPKQITYTILDQRENSLNVVDVSEIVVPAALSEAERLRHVRTTFLDIISEYQIERAGLRIAEVTSQNVDPSRIGLEAVLQESMASSPVGAYFAGRLNQIAALLPGVILRDLKPMIEGSIVFAEMDDWSEYEPAQRESILAASAALNLHAR